MYCRKKKSVSLSLTIRYRSYHIVYRAALNIHMYTNCLFNNLIQLTGELGKVGHVDFCVNGGKMQPWCENLDDSELCSHVFAICFMAQTVDGSRGLIAESCSRSCRGARTGDTLVMGHQTPMGLRGSYCLSTYEQPYCPKYNDGRGDENCCLRT